MVEVHRVAQVDLFQLVEDGGRVLEGPVQVDPVDDRGEFVDGYAGVRPLGGREFGSDALDAFGDGTPVQVRGRLIQQMRAHQRSSGRGKKRVGKVIIRLA